MQKNAGSEPATRHYTVVPNDTTPLSPIPRAIYCESSGTLEITDDNATTVSYTVTAGQLLPFRAHIITTNTTATVIAWY